MTSSLADTTALPRVSMIVPIRNEAAFIGTLLEQLHHQDYPPDKIEILVADGRSDDGTREILADFIRRDPRIRLIDNPARVVAPGLNAAIREAKGDVLMRIDGHTEIPLDYVRTSVQLLLERPEAWGVGGPIMHVGRTTFGRAAAAAMSHRAGVGNATHRFSDFEGYGEGSAFWTLHRRVFDQVGLFDETLIRTEDDEFNFRINQAGGKLYVSPKIRSRYFVRDTIGGLAQQYLQYAFWRIPVMQKHKRPTTLRQIVPLLFYLVMIALIVIGLIRHDWRIAAGLPICYLTTLGLIGLSQIPKIGWGPALLMPLAMATMHAAYAVGMACGLLASLIYPQAFHLNSAMTRLSR